MNVFPDGDCGDKQAVFVGVGADESAPKGMRAGEATLPLTGISIWVSQTGQCQRACPGNAGLGESKV